MVYLLIAWVDLSMISISASLHRSSRAPHIPLPSPWPSAPADSPCAPPAAKSSPLGRARPWQRPPRGPSLRAMPSASPVAVRHRSWWMSPDWPRWPKRMMHLGSPWTQWMLDIVGWLNAGKHREAMPWPIRNRRFTYEKRWFSICHM